MKSLRWMLGEHMQIDKESIKRVVTPSGTFEESEWIEKVEDLIVKDGEEDIYNKLHEYCSKELAWLKMKEFKLKEDIEKLEEDKVKELKKDLEDKKKKYRQKLDKEIKEMALKHYASRIWEDTRWKSYSLFNNLYIKGELQLAMI